MKITSIKLDKFLRPTHRKQEIAPETLTNFKQKILHFLANIHEPIREGKQETDLRDFLNEALYKGKFYINKKEKIDWLPLKKSKKFPTTSVDFFHSDNFTFKRF